MDENKKVTLGGLSSGDDEKKDNTEEDNKEGFLSMEPFISRGGDRIALEESMRPMCSNLFG